MARDAEVSALHLGILMQMDVKSDEEDAVSLRHSADPLGAV